jgi:hypothetical protein
MQQGQASSGASALTPATTYSFTNEWQLSYLTLDAYQWQLSYLKLGKS